MLKTSKWLPNFDEVKITFNNFISECELEYINECMSPILWTSNKKSVNLSHYHTKQWVFWLTLLEKTWENEWGAALKQNHHYTPNPTTIITLAKARFIRQHNKLMFTLNYLSIKSNYSIPAKLQVIYDGFYNCYKLKDKLE